MKSNTLLFVVTLSVLISSGAFAEDNATDNAKLTTRGYVDGGLSFVYQQATAAEAKADAAQNDVDSLENVVGAAADGQNPATGLVGKVADLENVVGATENNGLRATVGTLQSDVSTLQTNVNNLQVASKTYTGGTGITVTPGADNNPSTINLNLNNPTNGASYVFQSDGSNGGSWVALSVEDNWDSSAVARITATQNEQKSEQGSGE